MSNSAIGAMGSQASKSTEHTRKIGAAFSGAGGGGGGGTDIGSAHKVEPCGKDSFHLSAEAQGKE